MSDATGKNATTPLTKLWNVVTLSNAIGKNATTPLAKLWDVVALPAWNQSAQLVF